MLLSTSCEYGLRAALYVALTSPDVYVPIRRISKELDIEFHFLTKIFQQMSEAGIMQSERGPRGGVSLARPAGGVTLLDIVLAIEGAAIFEECVLGLPGCGERRPCPLHDRWETERGRIREMFEGKTLAGLAAEIEANNLRLRSASLPPV